MNIIKLVKFLQTDNKISIFQIIKVYDNDIIFTRKNYKKEEKYLYAQKFLTCLMILSIIKKFKIVYNEILIKQKNKFFFIDKLLIYFFSHVFLQIAYRKVVGQHKIC